MYLFGPRSVDTITASLTSMVTSLEQHAAAKITEAAEHCRFLEKYKELQDAAQVEAAKAKVTAAKIAALFS